MFREFNDIVPTGLAVRGNLVYMAEAGPVPHLPENRKVVSFGPNSPTVTNIASGAPLLVDVEFGRGQMLFALSQGNFSDDPAGSPALPNTGSLVKVNGDGSLSIIGTNLISLLLLRSLGTQRTLSHSAVRCGLLMISSVHPTGQPRQKDRLHSHG